jgi:pimeloyl-ACP methyl ester carboxylesterase
MVWAHGWGQNRHAFRLLAGSFEGVEHVLLDFPGFGDAPDPPEGWGTAEYAGLSAAFLASLPPAETVWIGHSFGCRVGLQLGAAHGELLSAMALVAAAGLKRRRTLSEQITRQVRIRTFKLLKLLPESWPFVKQWKAGFGSTDYRRAGSMRGVLVRVVNEDLTAVAARVRVPTLLVFGGKDTETPPEMGERLSRLIPGSRLHILPHDTHYSLLETGRHVVAKKLAEFLP